MIKFCRNTKTHPAIAQEGKNKLKYLLFDVAGGGVEAAAAAAGKEMGKARLAAGLLGRKENLIHLLLAGVFAALAYRSVNQQRRIEAMEAECGSLRATNKSLKSTMWDWKQQLLAEADESSPVPLSRLRALYGEVAPSPAPKVGETAGTGPASSPQKLVI